MSTIVYRDGIMVSDSRAYSGHNSPIGSKRKIARLEDGSLIGVSTEQPGAAEALIEHFKLYDHKEAVEKSPPHLTGGYEVLIVERGGKGYFANGSLLFSGPLEAPYFAIGSGATFAMGALEAGASALTALRIAARLDPWTAPPLHTLTHEGRHEVLREDGTPR